MATSSGAPITVIVPTHDHPHTLSFAVRSCLDQVEAPDVHVVIIGDGVSDETRDVASDLRSEFSEVTFVDAPKSSSRGEEVRDSVIRASQSPYIGYLGDDDLLLTDHFCILLETVRGRDFANPQPIFVRDGGLHHVPCDLSRRDFVDWHLQPVRRNSVSLTGVLHTRESYLSLSHGWRPTPNGRWSDHYMWEQFFSDPEFSGGTAPVATTIKLETSVARSGTPEQQTSEILRWWSASRAPGFRESWNAQVEQAIRSTAVERELLIARVQQRQLLAEQRVDALSDQVTDLRRQLIDLASEHHERNLEYLATSRDLIDLRESKTWRLAQRLRKMRRV